jgi:hypothetical protein
VNGYVGNQACAGCHSSIFNSFSHTAHAHASGPAETNLVSGEFIHKDSQVKYRVYSESGKVWMSFERAGDPLAQGKSEFLTYIDQGHRGTTYLFSVDGFFSEAPINLYTSRQMWEMAPAYGKAREAPMNLPVLTSCMDCHVSGIRPPIEGTENRYAMPLFLHAGGTCERCHGPGENHMQAGAIVNPVKLPPERRDQICMQCHLEGNAAVERRKHLYQYRPGARSDPDRCGDESRSSGSAVGTTTRSGVAVAGCLSASVWARSAIGMNLSRAFCSTRQFNEARNYTMRVLQFNPDLGEAKAMLKHLNADPPDCGK